MTIERIVIGSRGSELALWQAEWVKRKLETSFPRLSVAIELIRTTGDKILDSPLSQIGDKGLFTREIEQALLDRSIDLAVHSLKDLPTRLPEGLAIGAVTQREDARDVFIRNPRSSFASINDVPPNGTIATGSLRRKSQLLHWRSDLHIIDLRGNLRTRIEKLERSDWDGMILAYAGVRRLGWQERITEILEFDRMLPAVGQGALGLELRIDDDRMRNYLAPLVSEATTIATGCERSLLREMEGGCQIPIGAYGRIEDNVLHLDALVGSIDGKRVVRGKIHGAPAEAESLGTSLATTLLESGGRDILEDIRRGITSNEIES